MSFSKKIPYLVATLLSFTAASCALDHEQQTQQDAPKQQSFEGDFGAWDFSTRSLFNGGDFLHNQIKRKYAETHSYHPVYMGQSWMMAMGELASNNDDFRREVLAAAARNKTSYVRKLIENPQMIRSLPSSEVAFLDVLNMIAQNDALYKDQRTRLEAYARRQAVPNVKSTPRVVRYYSMLDYSTVSTTDPSVMERILNIAALHVLGLNKEPEYQNNLAFMAQNRAMTNCFATAKRNSKQCQAAAHDNYDLSYCMAQHNVGEVGKCFSWLLP